MARSYYDILEIEPDASDEEIRRAWRRLTVVWHPDRFENDADLRAEAERRLKEINQAYQELTRQRRTGRSGRSSSSQERTSGTDDSDRETRRERAARVWRVRDRESEIETDDPRDIIRWIERGNLDASDEVLPPGTASWVRLDRIDPFASILRRRQVLRWARLGFLVLTIIGIVLRRPLLVSIGIAFLFITSISARHS